MGRVFVGKEREDVAEKLFSTLDYSVFLGLFS